MCVCKSCDSCPRKNSCSGKIFQLYMYISHLALNQHDAYIIWQLEDLFSQLIDSTFFYLLRNWTFSQREVKSYLDFLREKYPKEDLASGNTSSNAIYMQRRNYIKRCAETHKVDFDSLWNLSKDQFELVEFIITSYKGRQVRDNSNIDPDLKQTPIFKMNLFHYMYGYDTSTSHKHSRLDFLDAFNSINQLYDKIEKESDSYFEKCVKYEHVEYLLHYETSYKFLRELHDKYSFITGENRERALQFESDLRCIWKEIAKGKKKLYEFPIFANMSFLIYRFFDTYIKEYKRTSDTARIMLELTILANDIVAKVQKYNKDLLPDFHISECAFAEYIFENYLGKGQHITKDKDLSDEIIDDLRKIYDKSDPIVEKIEY